MQLGEILVQKGYISPQQLEGALAVKGDEQIGQLLIQWGFLTQEQLLDALDIQAPPAPPPPPQYGQAGHWAQPAPGFQPQPPASPAAPPGGPDLTMDNLQTSKFKIDLKTMIYIGSLLIYGVTMYFTFMSELDSRFAALEGNDKDLMVEIDKRLTDLENTFTPIGEGVYTVDPSTTWPPGRNEYTMKQTMNANKITVIEETIERLENELEKLETKIDSK